jgi:uncharacterized damage-inducible protein DinB
MTALTLFRTLFGYQAWANQELLEKIGRLDRARHRRELQTALRLVDHCRIVNQIFAAHLIGAEHGFLADSTTKTLELADIAAAVTASDRWYLDYLETVSPDLLAEALPFVFTDGEKGCMTREEMLTHVVLHGGYHRGEVGRIIAELSILPPWDTFAVYLHGMDPSRRLRTSRSSAANEARQIGVGAA